MLLACNDSTLWKGFIREAICFGPSQKGDLLQLALRWHFKAVPYFRGKQNEMPKIKHVRFRTNSWDLKENQYLNSDIHSSIHIWGIQLGKYREFIKEGLIPTHTFKIGHPSLVTRLWVLRYENNMLSLLPCVNSAFTHTWTTRMFWLLNILLIKLFWGI